MEAADSGYNVFSTDDLWRQPFFLEEADTNESFLFAPLELDSEPSRLQYKTRERVN